MKQGSGVSEEMNFEEGLSERRDLVRTDFPST